MMLYPLAEVGIGVLVPVVVSRRQLVMDILSHRKGRNGEQEKDKADRCAGSKQARQASSRST